MINSLQYKIDLNSFVLMKQKISWKKSFIFEFSSLKLNDDDDYMFLN